jgi:hypothetical protein
MRYNRRSDETVHCADGFMRRVWRFGKDLRLKKTFGPDRLWVSGYSNDVMGYIPSLRVLKEGGYEGGGAMIYYVMPGPWSDSVEDTILHATSGWSGTRSDILVRVAIASDISRRGFLTLACVALAQADEPVIDIHQHTDYSGRTDEQLYRHQRNCKVTKTVMLPAGSKYGLDGGCGGNDTVVAYTRAHPKESVFFANELPDIPEAKSVIEKYLEMGAIGIGEQKFHVDCDSKPMQLMADIAKHYHVPVLMHFQHDTYSCCSAATASTTMAAAINVTARSNRRRCAGWRRTRRQFARCFKAMRPVC